MKTIYKKNPRILLGYLMAFAMVFFTTSSYAQCDHSFNMYDSYGDGWNGSSVDVTVNGLTVVTGAAGANMGGWGNSGPCGNELFSASSGDAIDLVNWVTGSYTSEVSWDITDGDGTVIASGVHGATLIAATGYCAPPPTCDNSFNMYDSYGDGWNGSTVDITVNGVVVSAGATGANMGGWGNSGPCGNVLVTVMSGDVIDLTNWVAGSYTSEVSWDITDVMGNVIASGTYGTAGPATANCVVPTNIPGCMDSTAWNYNPAATVSDTSCQYGCPVSQTVVTLPYSGSGLTNCGNGNVVNSGNSAVTGSYFNGDDGIYEFVAANDSTLLVSLTTSTTWTGLAVFDGCPTTGGSLSSISASSGGNESLSFTPTAGNTYYVVVSTYPSPVCVPSFDLYIGPAVSGCMSSTACNYDPLATVDDGSCTYPGCTDSLANNYDAWAGCDDGSCLYACTAAPYSENFDASMGTWSTWNTGSGSYPGWYRDANGTPSSFTGPSDDVTGGGFYMFVETSGIGGPYTLTSECLDISALAAPALRFQYHMYGASMGTLHATVNGDTLFTMSGDQGNSWNPHQIDLSAYVGSDITVEFIGSRGTSYTGDMAIDNVEVDEMAVLVIPGCMDPLALNYNSSANVSDSSCNYHCVNTASYGSATADPYGPVTVSTCNYLSEYSTISGVGAGESYTASISGINANPGYIVVYEGSSSGNFVAEGDAPLTWTSAAAGTHYIHWMVDSTCATATGCHTTTLTGNQILTIPGCTDATACNYNALANLDDGSCILPDGCTDSTAFNYNASALCDDGSCVPVVFGCTDTTATNYNAAANTDDGSCIAAASMCCNTAAYGSATANSIALVSISTCNYLTEYSTISGVDANTSYTLAVTGVNANPGWITVYEGSSCGNFIGEGSSPYTFTSTVAGTYYVHWSVDNSCATATGCHSTSIQGNAPIVPGCTNPLALNYNAAANQDDGSCVLAGCVSGIGGNSESFEDPAVPLYGQGPWANWNYDAATSTFTGTNGWRKDNNGTGSSGTGPTNGAPSLDGAYYLYCETSGQYGKVANLHSSCVDLTNFTDPTFVAGYHMAGATMGTLNIDVTTDGGTTWNNEWTKTGDQGTSWLEAVVPLTSYAGQIVQVRMNYTSGTSFTGDAAIDFLRFMEAPAAGCMDSTAANYDPSATIDDGSCQYPGCMDPFAVNYCSSCNVNDSLSCVYPSCQQYPFQEDWESGSTMTQEWLTNSGSNCSVYLQSQGQAGGQPVGNIMPVMNGAYHLEMTGHSDPGSYTLYATEAQAYANTLHVASATVCLDMTTAGSAVEMTFDAEVVSYFSNAGYAWGRVKVDGVVIADVNGNTAYSNATITGTNTWTYDMSAYAQNPSVNVTFEFAGRYGPGYSSGAYGCFFRVDDIALYDLSLCSYYAASATSTDVTCNGGSDGTATASTSNGSGMDMYMWDNGAYTASISGLSAGTYTCITMDDNWMCMDTVIVVIGEPSAISSSAVVVDESAALNDGSIDLSVSGGTPCITAVSLSSHNPLHSSNGQSGIHFNIMNTSAGDLTVTDFSQGNYSSYAINTMSAWYIPGGMGVPLNAAAGWTQCAANVPLVGATPGTFAAPTYSAPWAITPVVIPAGATYGFYIQGTGSFSYATATASGAVGSVVASDGNISITSGYGGTPLGTGSFSPRAPVIEVYYGDPTASAYTFAWSNGATSEDLSGLAGGTYGVTVTDCAGCTSTASYTVAGYTPPAVPGCTDTLANNYNALATVDDGSCTYDVPGCTDPLACNYDSTATVDDGSCGYISGCTDPLAFNYDSTATCDDGSCVAVLYGCTDPTACNYYPGANVNDPNNPCEWTSCAPATCGSITGVNMTDVIHDRATFNWDNMNDSLCVVDQIRIQYREVGSSAWSSKTMGAPVGNNAPALNTSKRVLNLSASTQYEYQFKIWYQDGTNVGFDNAGTFTTAAPCAGVTNVTATPTSQSGQANFCWTAPSSPYSFVRLKYREDVAGSSFINIGGMGVMSPQLCKTKNGITSGLTYRVMWRTWCNPTGGPYRSAGWDGPTIWTQPIVRLEGGTTINNLDVYPNPSRDIFNVTFTSEDVQDLDVRVLNIVGEVVYTENLQQFVGEYTKAIDLTTYTKGIYFLEITTNNGVVNKKLILQ